MAVWMHILQSCVDWAMQLVAHTWLHWHDGDGEQQPCRHLA